MDENIKDSLCRQLIPVVLVLMFGDTDKLSVISPRPEHFSHTFDKSKWDLSFHTTSDQCA